MRGYRCYPRRVPKINVYLPDDLAAAVRAAGIPVSPVCQEALATAVRKVNRARKAISAIRDPGFDPGQHPVLGSSLQSRMTPRLGEVFRLARQADGGPAGTGQLLLGVLEEGHNLGLRLLQAVDIDAGELAAVLRQADLTEPALVAGAPVTDPGPGPDLTGPAWRAVATALETAIELGHSYLGCEHLALGLAAETDSVAGRVLRDLGADPAAARKALTSVLAGHVHGRQPDVPAGTEVLGEVLRRLDALEARVAALGGVSG
jgi:Clp amino terminal domain, pathogenicity island component/Post-segregation antitoxin CcdA